MGKAAASIKLDGDRELKHLLAELPGSAQLSPTTQLPASFELRSWDLRASPGLC